MSCGKTKAKELMSPHLRQNFAQYDLKSAGNSRARFPPSFRHSVSIACRIMSMPQATQPTTLFQRALTSSMLTAGAYAITQGLRLVSNLILTRLLFPEAFGIMALVSVALVGLSMFSDMGIGPAISRHPRGDDPQELQGPGR